MFAIYVNSELLCFAIDEVAADYLAGLIEEYGGHNRDDRSLIIVPVESFKACET